MKKYLLLILLLCSLCIFINSCGDTDDNTTAASTTTVTTTVTTAVTYDTSEYEDYYNSLPEEWHKLLDAKREHRPTEEQLLSIPADTPIKEIMETAGKPHYYEPHIGYFKLIWMTDTGKEYGAPVAVKAEYGAPEGSTNIDNIINYYVITTALCPVK